MIWSIIISIILGIVIPILLPLVPNVTLTLGEQIVIGLLSAIVPVMLDIARSLHTIRKREEISQIILKTRNNFDSELLKLSNYFASFEDIREKGIFSSYFEKEILGLADIMLDASEKHKFKGRVQHVVDNNYILSCFGTKERKWRFTWILENENTPIISGDDAWNSYFNQAVSLLEKKDILAIDVLFIAEDQVFDLIKRRTTCGVQTYVHSFVKRRKPIFKLVKKSVYDENFKSAFSRETQINRDIGIYGNNLLFIYDNLDSSFGIYNENDADIKQYNTFFNNVWTVAEDVWR